MRRSLVSSFFAAAIAVVPAAARAGDDRHFEVTPIVGAWIPLGHGRQDLATAPLSGLQIVVDIDPRFAFVGTFSWVPTDAKVLGSASLDLLQYDLGARLQQPVSLGDEVTLRPHLGAGLGLRTLRFSDGRYPGGTDEGAYLSTGLDASRGAFAAGVTVRFDFIRTDWSALDATYHALEVFASAGLRF